MPSDCRSPLLRSKESVDCYQHQGVRTPGAGKCKGVRLLSVCPQEVLVGVVLVVGWLFVTNLGRGVGSLSDRGSPLVCEQTVRLLYGCDIVVPGARCSTGEVGSDAAGRGVFSGLSTCLRRVGADRLFVVTSRSPRTVLPGSLTCRVLTVMSLLYIPLSSRSTSGWYRPFCSRLSSTF